MEVLTRVIKENHPYDVPEVISVDIQQGARGKPVLRVPPPPQFTSPLSVRLPAVSQVDCRCDCEGRIEEDRFMIPSQRYREDTAYTLWLRNKQDLP